VLVQTPGIFRASHDSYVYNAADTARILRQGETVNASAIANAMQQPVSVAGISQAMSIPNRAMNEVTEGKWNIDRLLENLAYGQEILASELRKISKFGRGTMANTQGANSALTHIQRHIQSNSGARSSGYDPFTGALR
jgi:hypothetical protein